MIAFINRAQVYFSLTLFIQSSIVILLTASSLMAWFIRIQIHK